MSRPEQLAPPEFFYNESESHKYTASSRVQHIQAKMTLRALEILNLEPGKRHFVLDVGCGSGLSGEILTQEGHEWIGMDIAPSMLAIGLDREVDGDLFLSDMGDGVPFRAGIFDAAISISAIQWLCNADRAGVEPKMRLKRFFDTLYSSLKKGGKCVFQFYPSNENQVEQITSSAKTAGFTVGVVVDDPESKKNKKHYLVLMNGSGRALNLNNMELEGKEPTKNRRKQQETTKEYIMRKKELMRKRGRVVAKDSRYTARKRRIKF